MYMYIELMYTKESYLCTLNILIIIRVKESYLCDNRVYQLVTIQYIMLQYSYYCTVT